MFESSLEIFYFPLNLQISNMFGAFESSDQADIAEYACFIHVHKNQSSSCLSFVFRML